MSQPPTRRTPVLRIVLTAAAAALALGTAGLLGLVLTRERNVPDPMAAAEEVSVVEPATLGGRVPWTDSQLTPMTAEMELQFARQPGVTNSFAAFYRAVDGENTVLALVLERPIVTPEFMLHGAFRGFAGDTLELAGMTVVEPGPLGGTAQCGIADDGIARYPVCGWADEGSIGILVWYHLTVEQATAELPELRAEIETKES